MKIERAWAMPNKNTFSISPISKLIKQEMFKSGVWIDPYANQNKLATITNDINHAYDTDYHMDALEFLIMIRKKVEQGILKVKGVLFDPVYSPRQLKECYNNIGLSLTQDMTKASYWSKQKDEIARIVPLGGKVLSFGWNSQGMGEKRGFTKTKILLVAHGGNHNDTICTVEVRR